MPFRIATREPVGPAVRHVALEQLEKAFRELDADRDGDAEALHETVHSVRKRMKKLRALLRLIRDAAPDLYRCENGELRDAARRIWELRAAKTLLETVDDLCECDISEEEKTALLALHPALGERCRLASAGDSVQLELTQVRNTLEGVSRRAHRWLLDGVTWDDVVAGAARTYGRARKAAQTALDEDVSAEDLHQWRKRTKYDRYHHELLRDLWPEVLEHRYRTVKKLSRILGDHHHLVALQAAVDRLAPAPEHRRALEGLIARRGEDLLQQARLLGCKVFAEKKKHWRRRFGVYANIEALAAEQHRPVSAAPTLEAPA